MFLKNTYKIYRPFFSLNTKNSYQWFLIGLLFLGNVAQAVLIGLINSGFNLFLGGITVPGITTTAALWAAAQFVGIILRYGITAYFNARIVRLLTTHLNELTSDHYVKNWMDSKAYFGIKYLKNVKVPLVSSLLSKDMHEINRITFKLGDNFLNIFFSALVGVWGLWMMSAPLSLTVLGFTLVIPGYMTIAAILYSLTYNYLVSKFANKLQDITEIQSNNLNELEARIHHAEKNAESIELLGERETVKSAYFKVLKRNSKLEGTMGHLEGALAFFTYVNQEFVYFTGTFLSVLRPLAHALHVDTIYAIGDYFSRVSYAGTWLHDNYQDIINLKVAVGKFNELDTQNEKWVRLRNKTKVTFKKGDELSFKLNITTPEKTLIFNQKRRQTIPRQKKSVITGESGSGKTTLFRTVTGLYPHASGNVTYPEGSIVLPQKPYFPFNCTIYEVLSRKEEADITPAMKQTMNGLMAEFRLRPELCQDTRQQDWSDSLSGGEQQCIALIRVILQKPKVLIMDEPFSAMDVELQILCKDLLKKYLPDTTIIYIDHHPISEAAADQFHDFHFSIRNNQLVEVKPANESRGRRASQRKR